MQVTTKEKNRHGKILLCHKCDNIIFDGETILEDERTQSIYCNYCGTQIIFDIIDKYKELLKELSTF